LREEKKKNTAAAMKADYPKKNDWQQWRLFWNLKGMVAAM